MENFRTLYKYSEKLDSYFIKRITVQFLQDQARNAKGNLITFRPSKIAQDLSIYGRRDLRAKTVMIRGFLDELVHRGYITVIKRSARGKVYGLYRNGKLWDLLERYETDKILEILESEKLQ
ncbi:MAG: DNA-binding protein [Thermoproteus sp. AZ2]|jgi:hypothetical protein|uniref:DNA-binding protein n=1 Tax=Thermoproteus sp. AZ2 TaxID=1609232 RepID=A0ACC6UYP0_9CREN|nr:MAG: DNA-binding protein [Thermoproteus sp. AZ2]